MEIGYQVLLEEIENELKSVIVHSHLVLFKKTRKKLEKSKADSK